MGSLWNCAVGFEKCYDINTSSYLQVDVFTCAIFSLTTELHHGQTILFLANIYSTFFFQKVIVAYAYITPNFYHFVIASNCERMSRRIS